MTERLTRRHVLVVGAGTRRSRDPEAPPGNGRAIAVLAAREGAAVACADIDEDAAAETARLCELEGARAVVVAGDVSDAGDCERIVGEAQEGLDQLDGIVLNVGTGLGSGLAGTDAGQWDETFAINVRSQFLVCRATFPLLPPGSSIVSISSVAALKPATRVPAYDASKAALGGLCRHMAAEGAPRGIRVNVIAPGLIDTPLGRLANRLRADRAETFIPLGRYGTPWEVASVVVSFLSDETSYVTGQVLAVDGGWSALT